MIATGAIAPVSLAWKEGMVGWVPLNTIISCDQPTKAELSSPVSETVAQTSPSTHAAVATGPKGVGGWLVFFCVGLTILGPLFSLGQITANWERSQPAFDQFPDLKTAVMWENTGLVALLIYGFIAGCMIWSGSSNGRAMAKRYLLVRLFGFIGVEFIMVVIMGDMPSQVFTTVIGATVGAVFREIIYFLIWWFYFKKSKRVRNTYEVN